MIDLESLIVFLCVFKRQETEVVSVDMNQRDFD